MNSHESQSSDTWFDIDRESVFQEDLQKPRDEAEQLTALYGLDAVLSAQKEAKAA